MKTEAQITARVDRLLVERHEAAQKISPSSSPAEKGLFSNEQHSRMIEIMALKWVLG